jgi:hypothetical protein
MRNNYPYESEPRRSLHINGIHVGAFNEYFTQRFLNGGSSIIKIGELPNDMRGVTLAVKWFSDGRLQNKFTTIYVNEYTIIYLDSEDYIHRDIGPALIEQWNNSYYNHGFRQRRNYWLEN